MYGKYTGMIKKLVFGGDYMQDVSKICTHFNVRKISSTQSVVDIWCQHEGIGKASNRYMKWEGGVHAVAMFLTPALNHCFPCDELTQFSHILNITLKVYGGG